MKIKYVVPIHRQFDCFQQQEVVGNVKEINLSQLTVEIASQSDDKANYVDLTFVTDHNSGLFTNLDASGA